MKKLFNLKNPTIILENGYIVSSDDEDTINLENKSIIPIISDTMFKTLFERPEYIKYPCKLISSILDIEYEDLIDNVYFSNNELSKKYKDDLAYRNDLVVKLGDTTINIEMNNNKTEKIRNRNLFYLCRLMEVNKNSQVIQINLNNYKYRGYDDVINSFTIMDKDNKVYNKNFLIIDVYLPNVIKKSYNNSKLSELERLLLIGILEDREKAKDYIMGDEIMNEFIKDIDERSEEEKLLRAYDKELALKEEFYDRGIEQGYENGMEHGIEQERKSTINKLLASGMKVEEISNILSISIEEIEKIKDNI